VQCKTTLLASLFLGSGLFVLTGQQPAQPAIFTSAQADAGRKAYEATCGQCHTPTLLGRKGGPDAHEFPPIASLSEAYRKFIGPRGWVPPLAGPAFIDRWGSRTAAQLIARFQETVNSFGLDDGKDFTVNITAYILQVNGASAGIQPLTRTTDTIVNSAIAAGEPKPEARASGRLTD
jgi:hypothetical protein